MSYKFLGHNCIRMQLYKCVVKPAQQREQHARRQLEPTYIFDPCDSVPGWVTRLPPGVWLLSRNPIFPPFPTLFSVIPMHPDPDPMYICTDPMSTYIFMSIRPYMYVDLCTWTENLGNPPEIFPTPTHLPPTRTWKSIFTDFFHTYSIFNLHSNHTFSPPASSVFHC